MWYLHLLLELLGLQLDLGVKVILLELQLALGLLPL
jgi:hypothetical protein